MLCRHSFLLRKKKAIVVDPGGDASRLIQFAKEKNFSIKRAYHTHGHFDHILGSAELKEATGAELLIHKDDLFFWDNLKRQVQLFQGLQLPDRMVPKQPDVLLSGSESISIAETAFGTALATPGHSPGSMSYYFPHEGFVCTGDTLFRDSIGRTDLIGGSFAKLQKSVIKSLYSLPDSTLVIPGHGPVTSIGRERTGNVFVNEGSRLIDDSVEDEQNDGGDEEEEEEVDDVDEDEDDDDVDVEEDDVEVGGVCREERISTRDGLRVGDRLWVVGMSEMFDFEEWLRTRPSVSSQQRGCGCCMRHVSSTVESRL
ncbi:hypothetical protein HDU76_013173 [Blyttiomyces sp. JEL0837]|nr:hypothetical protein HDU76_013173 [Blyttiomyces sp. JEL0837]